MDKEEVIALMRSSKNMLEWKVNCESIKQAHNGQYPDYWFDTIIKSGLCDEILGVGGSDLKITTGKDALKDM